jgi:hypothetical protein
MNMCMLPCSLLPIVGNKSSDHVQHEKPESLEDMLYFGEHFDAAHEIEMELNQQLAGVGERFSDSIGHEETESVDEDSDGDWYTVIVLNQLMMSFHAEQMLCVPE